MDRSKYAWNQDYRDGYDVGVKDGREQMKNKIKYASNEIEKILCIFQDEESEENTDGVGYIKTDKGESEKKVMTYDELIKSFKTTFPSAEIEDYRPVCHEFFEKGKVGITIWLKNGDMVVYYPKQNEGGSE